MSMVHFVHYRNMVREGCSCNVERNKQKIEMSIDKNALWFNWCWNMVELQLQLIERSCVLRQVFYFSYHVSHHRMIMDKWWLWIIKMFLKNYSVFRLVRGSWSSTVKRNESFGDVIAWMAAETNVYNLNYLCVHGDGSISPICHPSIQSDKLTKTCKTLPRLGMEYSR